ncbi:MAG: hemolysin III family protein [Clostridiales bacterium]|jgi:hemolysin III|nr:hemolysin III family protein [Clostridiales bacterium]
MLRKIKEPFNSLSHLAGALISVVLTVFFIVLALRHEDALYLVGFLIFGIALVLLYTASAVYHMLPLSENENALPATAAKILRNEKISKILRRIDHMMIFVLIAGTYTPVCLVNLRGPWGWGLLAAIWALAFAGIILKACWINAPRWLSTIIYLFMGWLIVTAFYPLAKSVSASGVLLLILGGVAYSLGAVVYALKWPKLPFKHFGSHEIFHLFVLGGSGLHVLFMFRYVLRV